MQKPKIRNHFCICVQKAVMENVQTLQRHGWYLSEAGIKECSPNGTFNADEALKIALNLDLKLIGERHLPESFGRSKTEFVDGPFVLQVQKVRNVLIPREMDGFEGSSGGQKLFRLTLTDGIHTCLAVDLNGIHGLNNETPPGTKIKLNGRIPVNQGFLLLTKSNCQLLGGCVEKLVENWELKKSLAVFNRSTVKQEGGPPLFIPFGQRRRDDSTHVKENDNFKSLDSNLKKKEAEGEFEQQRKAVIEAALNEGKAKQFVPGSAKQTQVQQDKSLATILEMGFSSDQATAALKKFSGNMQEALNYLLGGNEPVDNVTPVKENKPVFNDRLQQKQPDSKSSGAAAAEGGSSVRQHPSSDRPGRRKGNKNDDEDYGEQHTRPSAPATLFDFVTSKIPATNSNSEKSSRHQTHSSTDDTSQGSWSNSQQSSSGGAATNLPPRLQKKQMKEELERSSFNKPMVREGGAMQDWSKDKRSNRQYDINSRGPVHNKSLWTDDKGDRNNPDRPGEKSRDKGGKNRDNKATNGVEHYDQGDRTEGAMQHRSSMDAPILYSVQSSVDCIPNGMQLVQSMDRLHLYPSTLDSNSAPVFIHQQQPMEKIHSMPSVPVNANNMANHPLQQTQTWNAGDKCMARWRDKQFYRAEIVQLNPDHVLVNFTDYNSVEPVFYNDLARWEAGGVVYQHRQEQQPKVIYQPQIVYQATAAEPTGSVIYQSKGAVNQTVPPGVLVQVAPSNQTVYTPVAVEQAYSCPNTREYQVTGAVFTNKSRRAAGNKQLYVPPAQRK